MLRKIYVKEMKDAFRDYRTLILSVVLPIIMMTGLTFFYEKLSSDGEGETFTLAVSDSITESEEAILAVYENIKLIKSANPEQVVQDGDAEAGVILSDNFSASIEKGEKTTVTLIGNTFSHNSSTLMSIVTNALTSYEKRIVSSRLEQTGTDPNLLQPFVIEQKEISEDDIGSNLLAMMVPLMLVLAIGIGAAPSAYDLFAGEKEKKTMEALLMTPVNRSTLLLSKWLSISSIGVITGIVTLLVVTVEIAFFTEKLKSGLSFGENVWMIVLLSLLVIIIFSMFNAALLMLTSIVAKTVKEAQSYSTPIMMLGVFPTMIISSIGVNELAFYHFAIPIMNIFSILKELLFGVINYEHILITVLSNLAAMIIIFILGRILFLKDKWVMS